MTSIKVENLGIRFPVHGVDSRSLKKELARSVGGRLGRGSARVAVLEALDAVSFLLEAVDRLGLVGESEVMWALR